MITLKARLMLALGAPIPKRVISEIEHLLHGEATRAINDFAYKNVPELAKFEDSSGRPYTSTTDILDRAVQLLKTHGLKYKPLKKYELKFLRAVFKLLNHMEKKARYRITAANGRYDDTHSYIIFDVVVIPSDIHFTYTKHIPTQAKFYKIGTVELPVPMHERRLSVEAYKNKHRDLVIKEVKRLAKQHLTQVKSFTKNNPTVASRLKKLFAEALSHVMQLNM